MILTRRALFAAAAALAASPARADGLELSGQLRQGGFALGRTWPDAPIDLDDAPVGRASPRGMFVVGFDRDAPPTAKLQVGAGARRTIRTLEIAKADFLQTRIDGLPADTVAPNDPALVERIAQEAALKARAFASQAPIDAFVDGFDWPLAAFRISSPWGAQRILNGMAARPHYGVDLAAPEGAPVLAPADGRVVLARTGLHLEGGLTLIDHGQGLITAYLHQSAIEIFEGQDVRRGQQIGRVGSTGRATGPHLCWRMKWRDRNLDPSLMVGFTKPASSANADGR